MYISPEKLRALRTDRKWSQDQLATACSLSLRTIQRIEKDGKCSADTHNALSNALAIQPKDLLPEAEASSEVTQEKIEKPSNDGYVGLSLAFLVIISLIVVSDSPLRFFDPFAFIATLSLAFSLTILSSGLFPTLESFKAVLILIKPHTSVSNYQQLATVTERIITHFYSAAMVITFIRLNTQVLPSDTPPIMHEWLNFALPLTYSVIINEVIWRPLKIKASRKATAD